MTTRIIRITECAECPKAIDEGHATIICGIEVRWCPPTGTPAWCPLEPASDTPSDTRQRHRRDPPAHDSSRSRAHRLLARAPGFAGSGAGVGGGARWPGDAGSSENRGETGRLIPIPRCEGAFPK